MKAHRNKFFNSAKKRAAGILKNKRKLNNLLKIARQKVHHINVNDITKASLLDRVKIMLRMMRAYIRGDYRDIKASNLLLIVAAIVYFVMPLDLMPDFIPVTGLLDDFSIIIWVYNTIQQEIDEYKLWEENSELY